MDNKPETESLLSSFRVLDLTDDKGYFCAKILGDLGAEVMRLEKPGDKKDFWWWAYNYKKNIVHLDIEKEPDRVLPLVKEADFLIESFPPGYLDRLGLGYATLQEVNPRLIVTSITDFGQTGPYKDFKASDLEIMAMSGMLYGMGDDDRPPVRISFPQSYLIASAEAAVGTLIAHCWREITGQGQQVDVSAQESVLGVLLGGVNRWKYEMAGATVKRMGGYHAGLPGIQLGGGQAKYHHLRNPMIWKCQDGHVIFLMHAGMRGARNNRTLVKYFEMEEDLPDIVREIQWETYDLGQVSPEDLGQVWDTFARFFARHTRQELYRIALKERIELFPGNTIKDILEEEQLKARGFWQEQEIPELGQTLKFPGPFARIALPQASPEATGVPGEKHHCLHRPFEGVKVLDFSWVYTGPWITQWLAVYGAEVFKVESGSHLDLGRRSGGYGFAAWNSGKKSITLNLKHPDGMKIARRLVAWADIVTENFTPGAMQRLGLGYDELRKINPRIIMFSASMLGADGPHAKQPGLGQNLTSLAGFNDLTGWPDRDPVSAHGPYTDVLACRMGGAVLFAAINYQRRTGQGCYIDMSQFEASLHFLAPLILEYQTTGKLRGRMGNRSLMASPHGVFPCQGEDRWCAISVGTDSEWPAFCNTLGRSEWIRDLRFDTFEVRKQNEDELERLIAEWTAQFPAEEVMTRLQQAGVKAGIVADWNDLYNDPQLGHRRHFIPVDHPELKEYDYSASGFRLGKSPLTVERAPLFGEHNKYACTQILGLSEDTFNAYLDSGVLE